MHLSIKGNAFLFGTYRKIQDSYVLDNYSVPYEIVEQAYRLYETGTKTKQKESALTAKSTLNLLVNHINIIKTCVCLA
jgi:hypothetical protein